MRRAADSDCAEDALSVLGLLEATGRYRVVHDRLPSNSSAAGVRPKRSGRPRRVRTAPVTEDKDSLKLQQQIELRVAYVKHSAWHGANSQQDVHASQGSQSMDGYADVDGAFDEDAESGRLQITVSTGEELILMPAPGAFQVGGRRDATKANLDVTKTHQPAAKRPRSRKQATQPVGEAPRGIPNPVNAAVAAGAPLFQGPQNQILSDANTDFHHSDHRLGLANVHGIHEDLGHDPFAQLSLPALNEVLEKRLNQRLVPQFQPHSGNSATATAKQFQREILQNRVEQFRAVLKQSNLLTSAHAQIAESLSNLGDLDNFPAAAKAHLKQDHAALLALKKLCKKAPKLAEQQVKFAAVMKEFDDATNQHVAAEPAERQLYTRQEMEAGMARAADEREAQVRKEFAARAAAAPEPADAAMLPLAADVMAAHSTNDRERDAAIQAIAYTLAPMHRLADLAANIEDVLFDCYNVNGKAGDKYWTRLKALVVHMCPESCESIWESTFGSQGSHATATDVSSASATGLSAANDADLGHTAQHLAALGPDLVAADSTRGKLWEGSMPVAAFATGS